MQRLWWVLASALSWGAEAKIPADYQPLVVEAPFSFSQRVFDLTAAVERAKQQGRPLYIYFGAADCPPCRWYELFLTQNRSALLDPFRAVQVVDIQSWINGPAFVFKIGERTYTMQEFKALVGDRNKRWSYPYFWLLSPELKQLKQLPLGSAYYTTVERQLDILNWQTAAALTPPGAPPASAPPAQSPPATSP